MYDKRIVTHSWGNNLTHDEHTSSNGFILSSNTYQHSINFLNTLASEAKSDFPHLLDEDIEVFTVIKSGYNQGFWGVRFPLPPGTCKPGYRQETRLDFAYQG